MADQIWGATKAEWEALAALCLHDVRPCVTNPHLYTMITKAVKERRLVGWDFSKRPSRVYGGGDVAGITAWQTMTTTDIELDTWKRNTNHAAGLVGRTIKAIDIDIDDENLADEVDDLLCDLVGADLPMRRRPHSGRRMLLYRVKDQEREQSKVVVNTPGGAVEFLGDRQFYVCAGMHESGYRHYWPFGIPESLDEIPEVEQNRVDEIIRLVAEDFGVTPDVETASPLIEGRSLDQIIDEDPLTKFVADSEFFIDWMSDGKMAVVCPWHDQHQSTEGQRIPDDVSATVFMPSGLGGRTSPGFKCMHVSHGPKTIEDFTSAIGYSALQEFDVLDPENEPGTGFPEFIGVSKTGFVPCNEVNLSRALNWLLRNGVGVAFDGFKQVISFRKNPDDAWQPYDDSHSVDVGMALNHLGMLSVSDTKLRKAINAFARNNMFDEGIEWVNSLRWDGEDRLKNFARDVLRTEDTPYHRAVVRYMFTALAGRVLTPGVKADMMPILYGTQGVRKTTFVQCLAPKPEWYAKHDFKTSAADAARLLRGKVSVELDELRGLASREEEYIKSWVTTTHDSWVPKYMEYEITAPRRFIAVGTTNTRRMLADSTGNRRWLPVHVCPDGGHIDTEYVTQHIEQLWAQGAAIYNKHGIAWQEAERLAAPILPNFQRMSATAIHVEQYLSTHTLPEGVNPVSILRHAFNKETSHDTAGRMLAKITHALYTLGYEERANGVWELNFL